MRHSLRWVVMLLALAAVPPISAQAQTGGCGTEADQRPPRLVGL